MPRTEQRPPQVIDVLWHRDPVRRQEFEERLNRNRAVFVDVERASALDRFCIEKAKSRRRAQRTTPAEHHKRKVGCRRQQVRRAKRERVDEVAHESGEDADKPCSRPRPEGKVEIGEDARTLRSGPRRTTPEADVEDGEDAQAADPRPSRPKQRTSAKNGGHQPKGLQEGWNRLLKLWLNSKSADPTNFHAFANAKIPEFSKNIHLPGAKAIIRSVMEDKLKKGPIDRDHADLLHEREMQVAHHNGLSNAAYLTQKRRAFMADAMRQLFKRRAPELKTDLNPNRAQLCASVDVVKMSNLAKNWAHWGMCQEKDTIDQFAAGVYDEKQTQGWLDEMRVWAEKEAAEKLKKGDDTIEKMLNEWVRRYDR